MKRLSQYLKNKRINSVTLLTVFTVYVIFYYTLTYWSEPIKTALADYRGINNFLFGSPTLQGDIFGFTLHNEVVFGFLAFLISFLSFKFLHNKSLGLTTLSFPETRSQLFNKKVYLPLALLIFSGVIAKTIALYWNYDFYGYSQELICIYITNILIFIHYILIGSVLGIFARVVTARTIEGILTAVGFILIPKTVYVLVDILAPVFLHGHCYFGTASGNYASFFDPIRDYGFGYGFHLEINITDPVSFAEIIYSAFWIVLAVISLILLKKYFVKNTKYENIGNNNKIPFISAISSAFAPLGVISLYALRGLGYEPTVAEIKNVLIIGAILSLVFGYIINAIITKTVLFKKEKVFSLSIIVAIPSIITLILATGGFGFETRIPEADKIKKVTIDPTTIITEMAFHSEYVEPEKIYSSRYADYDKFFRTDTEVGPYYQLEFTNEMDFEKVLALHNSAIYNKSEDTVERFIITYELKNGSKLYREYSYISEETVKKLFELLDTETVKSSYEDWLLNSDEILEEQKSSIDFNMIYNKIPLSKGAKITLNSIDSVASGVSDLSEADFLALKTAIYNDVQALTWKEWFMPENSYGTISFYNTYTFKAPDTYEADYFDDYYYEETEEGYTVNFVVTSEMTNTIKCLEKLGLMEHFNRSRAISKAYLIDTEDCGKVWLNTRAREKDAENPPDFYHSVLFDITTKEIAVDTHTFINNYSSTEVSSSAREVSGEELEELLEKGHIKYYCGTDSYLLFVWTRDLTHYAYAIPK